MFLLIIIVIRFYCIFITFGFLYVIKYNKAKYFPMLKCRSYFHAKSTQTTPNCIVRNSTLTNKKFCLVDRALEWEVKSSWFKAHANQKKFSLKVINFQRNDYIRILLLQFPFTDDLLQIET
jgi:hypothetical protein